MRIPVAGIVGETALREAATTELQQTIELIRAAVRAKAKIADPDWVEVTAVYPDRAVIRRANGRLYAYPVSLGDNNDVTVGEPTEVVLDHKPVAALREAATGTFIEAVAGDEGQPPRYLVRVIRAGLSLNGVSYPAAVLREAAPLFDNARVFVKSDAEHVKGGGKDVRQLVGKLTAPRFVEAAGGGEIQAVLDVLESAPIAAQLRESVQRGMTDLFGLSIDAQGAEKRKNTFREATRITRVVSVDLIVEPGAGGQVIRFTEAVHHEESDMLRQQMITAIAQRNSARAEQLAQASDEEVLTAYREAVASPPPAVGISEATLEARLKQIELRAEARGRIAASALPQQAKDRLDTQFREAASIDLAEVDQAIAAEQKYVSSFREAAPITGLGLRVEAGEDRADKIAAGLDGFFASDRNGFRSFREAYIEITGDRLVTGLMQDCDTVRLREAAGTHFREAVSSSTFANILGNAITRAMIREYGALEAYQDWRWLCDVVPVTDFRTQERTRVGGYGNLPAVAENGAYTALTSPGDDKATYAVTKRGGIETISLEAIANDDVGLLRRIPLALATAAGRTLYEFVYDFLATNPTVYDSVALFHASHANLGTAALDATTYAAARLAIKKQTELSSSKRLGITLSHLVIPSDLEEAAYNLFVRNSNQDETFVQSRKPVTHVVDYWTDTNNWFATADNRQVPLIELGFYGGEDPAIFVQDNPTQGSLFSNDQIKYKIRHIYSGAVRDYRGFYGAIVA